MSKRLIRRRADALVELGRPILARLEVDSRLAESAASMRDTQNAFESKVLAFDAARIAEQIARARRDEAHRLLAAVVREFGYIVLSCNGNHHNADPYLLYFPEGYGNVMQFPAGPLADFARMLLAKLANETDPKILAYRDPIEEFLNRFVTAETVYQEAQRARSETFSVAQAGKRYWERGAIKAQALAEWSCHYERAYIHAIFASLKQRRRSAACEAEPEETPAAAAPGPQIVSVPPLPQGEHEESAA